MRTSKPNLGLVTLLFLAALVALTSPTKGQESVVTIPADTTPKPTPPDDYRDLSKYGSVRYDTAEKSALSEERRIVGVRYDNLGWVYSSIDFNPDVGGVGRITHDPIAS